MKPKLQVDASLLKEFSCIRRVWFKSIRNKAKATPNIALVLGSAFHVFAARFVETLDHPASLVEAVNFFNTKPASVGNDKRWMNGEYLTSMCTAFASWFMSEDRNETLTLGGQKALEKRFLFPYKEYPHVDIFLSGTIDRIAVDHTNKILWIEDYKTTSLWDKVAFFRGFDMSIQLRFYRILLRALFDSVGLFPDYEIRSRIIGIFLASGKFPVIQRSQDITYRQRDLDETVVGIDAKVHDLAQLMLAPEMPYPEGLINDTCERKFGKCDFYSVCSSSDPELELNISFIDSDYNPMTHGT